MLDLTRIFHDARKIEKIQKNLPDFFQMAEADCSRNDKIGMDVGVVRERIIVTFFQWVYGKEMIHDNKAPSEGIYDIVVGDTRISIKTITARRLSSVPGIKLKWVADQEKARSYYNEYYPSVDLILVIICWGTIGGFYYIPLNLQMEIFQAIEKENYVKLHLPNTNNKGVELSTLAVCNMIDKTPWHLKIDWIRRRFEYDPNTRWLDLWNMG